MEALTLARAKELATEIVEEFGKDYTYPEDHKNFFEGSEEPSCVYVHQGKPSCLVGQILHRHGVSLEDLSKWENRGAFSVAYHTADAEEEAQGYLSALQCRQDEGQTWGQALKIANSRYGV